jgi:hypothetical protein
MNGNNNGDPWDHFYNGTFDTIDTLYEVEPASTPHSISLMDRLGDPIFLKNSSLVLRVIEEIYSDIRKRAARLENRWDEV